MNRDHVTARQPALTPVPSTNKATRSETCLPACPACGGALIEIRHKLTCSRCHTICETCCEGGRG